MTSVVIALTISLLVISYSSRVISQTTVNQMCAESFDLVVILDSSGSIRDNNPADNSYDNWNLILSFVARFVDYFDISASLVSGVRVAAVTFSNKARIEFNFHTDRAAVKADILNTAYEGGNTNTSGAIKVMMNDLFFNEAKGDRLHVNDVTLIITDGHSTWDNKSTLPSAQEARTKGIQMFTIGVTKNVNVTEIREMSSAPQLENTSYWLLPDFTKLDVVIQQIVNQICTSQSFVTNRLTNMDTTTPLDSGLCPESFDLVVALDNSGSIRDNNPPDKSFDNWNLTLSFVSRFIDFLHITSSLTSGVRVAGVSFSNKAKLEFNFQTDKTKLKADIMNITYQGRHTNTSGAIKLLTNEVFFQPSKGDRLNVKNVALIITDGHSTWDNASTLPSAKAARDKGIQMFTIGITSRVNVSEVKGMSSSPQSENTSYWLLPDFTLLEVVVQQIVAQICVSQSTNYSVPVPTTQSASSITSTSKPQSSTTRSTISPPSRTKSTTPVTNTPSPTTISTTTPPSTTTYTNATSITTQTGTTPSISTTSTQSPTSTRTRLTNNIPSHTTRFITSSTPTPTLAPTTTSANVTYLSPQVATPSAQSVTQLQGLYISIGSVALAVLLTLFIMCIICCCCYGATTACSGCCAACGCRGCANSCGGCAGCVNGCCHNTRLGCCCGSILCCNCFASFLLFCCNCCCWLGYGRNTVYPASLYVTDGTQTDKDNIITAADFTSTSSNVSIQCSLKPVRDDVIPLCSTCFRRVDHCVCERKPLEISAKPGAVHNPHHVHIDHCDRCRSYKQDCLSGHSSTICNDKHKLCDPSGIHCTYIDEHCHNPHCDCCRSSCHITNDCCICHYNVINDNHSHSDFHSHHSYSENRNRNERVKSRNRRYDIIDVSAQGNRRMVGKLQMSGNTAYANMLLKSGYCSNSIAENSESK